MQILINISDQKQAERFLTWIQNRGDITLGDEIEIREYTSHEQWLRSYVYIGDATEVSHSNQPQPWSVLRNKPGPY